MRWRGTFLGCRHEHRRELSTDEETKVKLSKIIKIVRQRSTSSKIHSCFIRRGFYVCHFDYSCHWQLNNIQGNCWDVETRWQYLKEVSYEVSKLVKASSKSDCRHTPGNELSISHWVTGDTLKESAKCLRKSFCMWLRQAARMWHFTWCFNWYLSWFL